MSSLIHADIFFLITTIVVIVVGILLAFVLLKLAGILKNVKDISDEAKEEAARIVTDVADLRQEIREHGEKFSGAMGVVENFLPKSRKVGSKQIKKKTNEKEN